MRIGGDFAKLATHTFPDGLVRLGGNLLSDNGVDERREQVRDDLTLHLSDLVNDLRKPLVSVFEIFDLFIAINEYIIHSHWCYLQNAGLNLKEPARVKHFHIHV